MLDRFPQRDFGLWVFMCTTNVSLFLCLFCDHLYCTGYHAQGYHALTTTARLPRRGLPRPILTTTGYHACVYISVTTPELSRFHQYTYIGLSHPLLVIRTFVVFIHRLLLHLFFSSYTTTGRHTLKPTPHTVRVLVRLPVSYPLRYNIGEGNCGRVDRLVPH